MPRLVVVLPLEPLQAQVSFAVDHWPLHITIVPPFHTESTPDEIAAAIAAVASSREAITAVAGHDEMFGRRHDVPVTVVVENEALSELHRTLVDALRPFAARPEEPAFTGRGFRPHITLKQHRVHDGDEMTLTQIALVDMAPRSEPGGRTVLATLRLAAPER